MEDCGRRQNEGEYENAKKSSRCRQTCGRDAVFFIHFPVTDCFAEKAFRNQPPKVEAKSAQHRPGPSLALFAWAGLAGPARLSVDPPN